MSEMVRRDRVVMEQGMVQEQGEHGGWETWHTGGVEFEVFLQIRVA